MNKQPPYRSTKYSIKVVIYIHPRVFTELAYDLPLFRPYLIV